jgi:hypothetical protein
MNAAIGGTLQELEMGSSNLMDRILAELSESLNLSAGAHSCASMGLRFVAERFDSASRLVEPNPDNPDPTLYFGLGDPNEAASRQYARWKVSELSQRLAQDGPVVAELGRQWLILIFTQWDSNFRPRLAAALGVEVAQLKVPVFGDLRHMRNDLLHNGGVASKDHTGRCESLHWFEPGKPIVITAEQIAEFMENVGPLLRIALKMTDISE